MQASGLYDAHEDLMVMLSFSGAVSEGHLSHDDTWPQTSLYEVIVGGYAFIIEAGDKLFEPAEEFPAELICFDRRKFCS